MTCSIPLQRIDRKRTFDTRENKTNGETESQTTRFTRSQARKMTNDERQNKFISLQDTKRKVRKGHSSNDRSSAKESSLKRDKENICPNIEPTQSKRKLEKTDNDLNVHSEFIHHNKKRKIGEASKSVENEKITNQPMAVSNEFYRVGQVVWAKLRCFPSWPAKIERICGDKKQLIEIYWFNDYRRSKVFRSQIFDFHKHFAEFAVDFDKHIGLEMAAKEALIYIARK